MATSLESRHFVATPADITALTTSYLEALKVQGTAPGTYLKALVATTQAELGIAPRQRTTRSGALSDEDKKAHLAALEAIHERFYGAVEGALAGEPPKERHRRGTFARSAMSTLRSWIRAGGDLRSLAASKTTKASLKVASTRTAKPATIAKRADRLAKRVVSVAMDTAKTDKPAARELLEATIARLAAQLIALGATPTKKMEQAVEQHRPFQTKEGDLFWPANEQSIRLAQEAGLTQ